MRRTSRFSLALVVVPILFSGCMQEKVSKISPPKLSDSNLSYHQLPQKTLTKVQLTASSTSPKANQDLNILQPTMDHLQLDDLMNLVQQDLLAQVEITGKEGNYSTPIEVQELQEVQNDNWQEITKEEELILTATAYLGTEYVWAANGPDAFDCSGFTKYVYKEIGITLPRYSGNQAKVGTKVSFNELQKGDLVFFDTEKKFKHKVNHVGIYIGDGKFIHASSAKKKVIITSFNRKQFYKRRFLWGQRVVNSFGSYASLK